MIGMEKDILRGGVYGIQALSLIVDLISNAKLYIISINGQLDFLEDLIDEYDLKNNIKIIYNPENETKYYLNTSVLLNPSLSKYYPYFIDEAKSHAIPIIGFNLSYNPAYQKGIILVDKFDYKQMANEAIKLLENYQYRKIRGLEAKLSLSKLSDREAMDKWENLFTILDKNDSQKLKQFQINSYKDYYNEKKARERLKSDYKYDKEFNRFICCHSFNNMIKLYYLNNIKECKSVDLCK